MVLHPLPEGLGRHVNAREHLEARRGPARHAAVQHVDIGAAEPTQQLGQAPGIPLPAIGADNAHRSARQQARRAELGLGERAGHRPEQMGGTELAFLPRIENGEFLPIAQPCLERGRSHHGAHPSGARLGFMKALL